MNRSQARAIKRRSSHTYYDRPLPDGTVDRDPYDNARGTLPAEAGHVPNKNEAKALRRICAQTGLTPEQVRQHKKYRQMLAQAAGPQFRTHDNASKREKQLMPWLTISDPELRDQAMFAYWHHMDVNASYFQAKWAEEKRRRLEQALINKLSQPW